MPKITVKCNNVYCKHNVISDDGKRYCYPRETEPIISLSLNVFSLEGNEIICKSFESVEINDLGV